MDDAVAPVKHALIALGGSTDRCPWVAVQVDISRQLGAQRYLSAIDPIGKPRQLRASANEIRLLLRTAAGGLGLCFAVPLVFLRDIVGLYGHLQALHDLPHSGLTVFGQRVYFRCGLAVVQCRQGCGLLLFQRLASRVQLLAARHGQGQPDAPAALIKGSFLLLQLFQILLIQRLDAPNGGLLLLRCQFRICFAWDGRHFCHQLRQQRQFFHRPCGGNGRQRVVIELRQRRPILRFIGGFVVLAPYLRKLRLQRLLLAVQFHIRCLRLGQLPAQQRPAAVLRRQ